MSYTRKTRDEFVIQANYGYGHGWEDVDINDNRTLARENLAIYRLNEKGVPFRLIRRRAKKED